MPTPHMQHPSSGSAETPSFDADYIPSELDISALSDHQIKGEALEHLRQIICDTMIPSSWTRVPHKMGSPSPGSLKADVRCDYETDDDITINQQYYVCSYEI
ncbi:hypothetical protein O181_113935 [Austropuccinia psidii MF-1]|uniref:Uncharacterized protein n=1 Tax=Austropuccinia psidii MF-1 TaxID=1389203 RepID=A0A9Q3PV13_9BASI|nr:hypothetical protein [Austropuccinia psidii MF-1]